MARHTITAPYRLNYSSLNKNIMQLKQYYSNTDINCHYPKVEWLPILGKSITLLHNYTGPDPDPQPRLKLY